MALVLSLKEGEDFYLGDTQFTLTKIIGDNQFTIRNEETGRESTIVSGRLVEVMQGVQITAGDRPQPVVARVTIEARQDIKVLRGDKYRNPPEHIRRQQRHGR